MYRPGTLLESESKPEPGLVPGPEQGREQEEEMEPVPELVIFWHYNFQLHLLYLTLCCYELWVILRSEVSKAS